MIELLRVRETGQERPTMPLGNVWATPRALSACRAAGHNVSEYLTQHLLRNYTGRGDIEGSRHDIRQDTFSYSLISLHQEDVLFIGSDLDLCETRVCLEEEILDLY